MCAIAIGELAERVSTPVATIRYYENIGLLPEPLRGSGGQRRYGLEDQRRLEFIRSRRMLGFGLKDIAKLLGEYADCRPNLAVARAQLDRVRSQIAALEKVSEELQKQISSCESGCNVSQSTACQIVPAAE